MSLLRPSLQGGRKLRDGAACSECQKPATFLGLSRVTSLLWSLRVEHGDTHCLIVKNPEDIQQIVETMTEPT